MEKGFGYVQDVCADLETGTITHIIVPGSSKIINIFAGNNDIAVSNIIGSNIFNGLVVVGICAFMAGFKTNRDILKRDMPVNILITAILCVMIADGRLSRL